MLCAGYCVFWSVLLNVCDKDLAFLHIVFFGGAGGSSAVKYLLCNFELHESCSEYRLKTQYR